MMRSIGSRRKAAVVLVGLLLVAINSSSSTVLLAAGRTKVEAAPSAVPADRSENGATPPVLVAGASKNDGAIKKAIHGIHSDLKRVKLKFFQLRYIEDAKVYNNEFRYTMGLQHDSRVSGPTFSKYGCDIYVHIQYPATKQDMDQTQLEGVLVPLKNGSAYAVWKLIRTETTEEGQAFAEKVDQIVTARLDAMKKELEQD